MQEFLYIKYERVFKYNVKSRGFNLEETMKARATPTDEKALKQVLAKGREKVPTFKVDIQLNVGDKLPQ